ncbi:hypothetical protein U9199_20075 [Escherichia coli]
MKLITYSFLLFLFIYNIPIIGIFGTGYLSSIIVFFIILADKKKHILLVTLLKQKIIYILLSIYLAIIIFGFISTIFNHSYDFTINRTLINNILSLFCCLFFIILFFEKPTVEKHFSIILILQSFIIIAMILSSDIREFIQSYVRTEDEIEYMSGYGGVRGLGVSGSMAFGLAATMGLLGYIFIFHINNANNSSIYNIFIFFICFFASLSAGRTSFLGFFLGLLILTLYSISLKTTFKVLKYLIITILISILFYIILINIPSISEIIEKYSAYAFQPIINYLEYGSLSVTSTEKLQSMYFLPNDTSTIFFGDGKYTTADGYYMSTDAGYMRFMLYFGILGSLLPYFGFLYLCFYTINRTKINTKKSKWFFGGIILLSFIYHYKGEIIFFNVSYMKIIFIYCMYYILINKLKPSDVNHS